MPPLPHPRSLVFSPIHSPPGSPVPDEDFVVLHRPPTPAPSSPSPPFIRRSSGSVLLPSRENAPPAAAAAIAPYAFSAPIPILVTRGVTPDACLEQEILPRSSHGYHNPGAPIRLLPFLDRPPSPSKRSGLDQVSGILLRNRQNPIPSRHREPLLLPFLDDDNEIFYSDSEDDSRIPPKCIHCGQSAPVNLSLQQHQELGPFASTHMLGLQTLTFKTNIAIIAMCYMSQETLFCKFCDHFEYNLQNVSEIQDKTHLFQHGHHLGPNPTVATIMANTPIPNIHLCWVCCKVFPSQLSLLLHCALVNHENTTDIYCGICHLIVHDTTQFSHVQAHHDLFTECPMCPGSLIRSMDLIVHLQSATVHPHWEQAKRHLTCSQIIYLDATRTAEIGNFVCTDTGLNELLESTSMQVHLDYLAQPDLLEVHKNELAHNDIGFPADQVDLIARYLPRSANLRLSVIVLCLKNGQNLFTQKQHISSLKYELLSILTHISLRNLYCSGILTPTNISECLIGPDSYQGPCLLTPSILTQS